MLSLSPIAWPELWGVRKNRTACLTGALCQITRLYVWDCVGERESMSVHLYACLLLFSLCEEILPNAQHTETGYGWRQESDGWHHWLAPSAHHYYGARWGGIKKLEDVPAKNMCGCLMLPTSQHSNSTCVYVHSGFCQISASGHQQHLS